MTTQRYTARFMEQLAVELESLAAKEGSHHD